MRALRRAILALALVLVVALGALGLGILVPRAPAQPSPGGSGGSHEIVLIANAIHTDIALPATPEVRERLSFLRRDGLPLDWPDVAHVLVGWGGRTFYTQTPTWADLRADTLYASFTRDDSVLHFSLAPRIDPSLPGTLRLTLDDAQFEALLGFIEDSLGEETRLIDGAGYGAYDLFYEAQGWFNVLFGCNTWTAAALRRAGIATGFWTPLPQGLLWSIAWQDPR